jgi:hypothetical protein
MQINLSEYSRIGFVSRIRNAFQKKLTPEEEEEEAWEKGEVLLEESGTGTFTHALQLIKDGAKLNLVDKEGHSALFWACFFRKTNIALLLIEKGAPLNHVDFEGDTVLDWAEERGLAEVAAVIREKGGKKGTGKSSSLAARKAKLASRNAKQGGRRTRKHRSRRRHTRKH